MDVLVADRSTGYRPGAAGGAAVGSGQRSCRSDVQTDALGNTAGQRGLGDPEGGKKKKKLCFLASCRCFTTGTAASEGAEPFSTNTNIRRLAA